MNQHIQNIEISNFKSIKDLKIDGCKKINIFAGKPNAGKSNILEALSVFDLLKNKKGEPELSLSFHALTPKQLEYLAKERKTPASAYHPERKSGPTTKTPLQKESH